MSNLRIGRLKAENFKRLKLVEFSPQAGESVVGVGGRNGQGKTSLLDAIAVALGGTKLAPDVPVRIGEDKAEITLDINDESGRVYRVRRTFKASGGGTFEITGALGETFKSPQSMLDRLLGDHGFTSLDPHEFSRAKPKEQFETLRAMVGIDFSQLDFERKRYYDERTLVNRQLDTLKAKFAGTQEHADTPEQEQSATELSQQLAEAERHNARLSGQAQAVERLTRQLANDEQRIAELEAQLETARSNAIATAEALKLAQKDVDDSAPVDTGAIAAQINQIEETNRRVRQNAAIRAAREEWAELEEKRVALNKSIEDIDQSKASAIAEAKMPIQGLTFGEDTVLYNGVPLEQSSASERLKVSTAVALALAGDLNIVLLRDASLLDDESLADVRSLVEAAGGQAILELVGDDGPVSVVIEDGEVRGTQPQLEELATT